VLLAKPCHADFFGFAFLALSFALVLAVALEERPGFASVAAKPGRLLRNRYGKARPRLWLRYGLRPHVELFAAIDLQIGRRRAEDLVAGRSKPAQSLWSYCEHATRQCVIPNAIDSSEVNGVCTWYWVLPFGWILGKGRLSVIIGPPITNSTGIARHAGS